MKSSSVEDKIKQELRKFNYWIVSFIPEPIKKTVSDKMKALKNKISNIYNAPQPPRELKSAFKGSMRTFRVEGRSAVDYKTFLQRVKESTVTLLNKQDKPMKVRLLIQCQFYRVEDGEKLFTDYHFSTKNEVVFESTNLTEMFDISVERLIELIESLEGRGSGWIFLKVLHFDIFTNLHKPLAASSYIQLPKFLATKKALINPKNTDNECFKWCVTEIVYPQKANRERVTRKSRENAKLFNWTGIEFPMRTTQIDLFEKNNPKYAVNVLGYEGCDGLYPISRSKHYTTRQTTINLLLISNGAQQHYVIVENMSRLIGMQTNKHKGKSFICLNCFNTFSIEKSFKQHTEFCLSNETVRVDMPKKGASIKFDKFGKTLKVPFVIYADFESFTEKIHSDAKFNCEQSYTRKYQKHTPSGFCYYIVYRGGVYKKPTVYTGENVAEEFCKHIEMETREIYNKYLKKIVPLKMTQDDVNRYEENNVCHICERSIDINDPKVKDHNHLTGEFVGAAHQSCNLAFKEPSFIPIVFHNLSGYDAHLFIKQLGILEDDINCIADNEEKYISFTKRLQVDTFTNEKGVEKKVY